MKDLFKGCWTVPNLLTALRIVMVPIFAYLFVTGHIGWAVLVLALSGLSDFFDGKIARRFNQVSPLGKLLDPIADKLTQITLAVLLYLTFRGATDTVLRAFSWVFLVFIVKEMVMVVGGAIMLAIGLRPGAAEIYGKIATFAFYAIMLLIIAFGPEIGWFRHVFMLNSVVMIVLVCVSAVLTLVAFCSYMPALRVQVKEHFAKKKEEKSE